MTHPNLKTKVVHSETKAAWNIINDGLQGKFKIARIPYLVHDDSEVLTTIEKNEALEHALFISFCFNNSDKVTYK